MIRRYRRKDLIKCFAKFYQFLTHIYQQMNKEYMRMNKEVAFCRDGNDFDDLIFPELMAKDFEILQYEKKFVEMIALKCSTRTEYII